MEVILVLCGFISGWLIRSIFEITKKKDGDLLVTHDEDGTYLSLNIDSIESVTSKKEVIFKVVTRN